MAHSFCMSSQILSACRLRGCRPGCMSPCVRFVLGRTSLGAEDSREPHQKVTSDYEQSIRSLEMSLGVTKPMAKQPAACAFDACWHSKQFAAVLSVHCSSWKVNVYSSL